MKPTLHHPVGALAASAEMGYEPTEETQELVERAQEGKLLPGDAALINQKDEEGFTALAWATQEGQGNAVKNLLQNKADPNLRSKDEATALILAGINGHQEVAEALLQAKAEINAKDYAGKTALDLARENCKPVTAKLLEEAAKLTPEQRSDKAEWKKIEAVVKKAEEDAMSGEQLRKAAEVGDLERVQELLAQRADVETKGGDWNRTALIQTGLNGRTDIAQALLAAGANVNAADKTGYMALHYAGGKGHTATAQALLAAGAHPEAKTLKDGYTALHEAGLWGHTATAQALLAAGAHTEAKDNGSVLTAEIPRSQLEGVRR
eukprot:g66515.t1